MIADGFTVTHSLGELTANTDTSTRKKIQEWKWVADCVENAVDCDRGKIVQTPEDERQQSDEEDPGPEFDEGQERVALLPVGEEADKIRRGKVYKKNGKAV